MNARGAWSSVVVASLLLAACAIERVPPVQPVRPEPPRQPSPEAQAEDLMPFSATAYSIEGRTASGAAAREGMVAADPQILPLGSRVRIEDAGPYSGEYVVKDTGRAIDGREIDIYLASDAEAKKFGRRQVKLRVLDRGAGSSGAARDEPLPVEEVKAPALR